MSTTKDRIHALVDELPDNLPMDAAMYELQVRAKVARGLEQVARGEVVTQEEARKRLARWLESPGP